MMKTRMRFILVAAIALAGIAIFQSLFVGCSKENADTTYINGNIYTVDENFSRVEALVIRGDRIVYAGDSITAQEAYKASTTVDIAGRTVVPGLIDSHLHYQLIGSFLDRIDIFQKSKEEILSLVAGEAARLGPGKWIVSMGWNNVLWGEDYPTKEELDAVAPDNPVALSRVDGHSTWYNSMSLRLAGIDRNTPNPRGGEILKKPNGDVWGILTDNASGLVYAVIEDDTAPERVLSRFSLADQAIISYGITTLVDAGESWENIKVLRSGYEAGTLHVRAYEMLSNGSDIPYIAEGNRPTTDVFGDGRLAINAVKLVSDGALGSRSAWLLSDYTDRPGHVGNGRLTNEEANAVVKRVADEGFQIGAHAIGDAAVQQIINAYVVAVGEENLRDRRFRIEHYQIVNAHDISRTIRLGIIPSMQTVHATSDMNMAEDRVGPVRILSSYAWRTIVDLGGYIANGTDAPVELVNPYYNLYAAVSRQDRSGQPPSAWYPEQALRREEALRSYTIWGAHAIFAEGNRGSLEAGKYADFVVLDRDYMTCPTSEIDDITALRTVIGGKVVYQSP
ncbi:MAG: amidohydrolase [Spirochaetaceae bacterium]|jgi:predicted amidohydrolase YtcJ|nr:amidohydrolase [Spirochaetaceae bacterium]